MRRRAGGDCAGRVGWAEHRLRATAPANPLAPKRPPFRREAKNVIFLFMAGAPSHLELFDNKPQLAKFDGTLPPAGAAQGLSGGVHQSELEAAGAEVQVRQARPVRGGAVGAAAAPGDGRRRHRDRQVDGHRRVQSRAGPDPDEHRLAAVRQAEPGGVDAVRPGQRIAESAGVRRVQHGQERAERRQLRTGAAAFCRPCIRACRSARAATRCCICRIRAASIEQLQRESLDAISALNQQHLDAGRRSGNCHADQLVRDGVSHAGRAPRS